MTPPPVPARDPQGDPSPVLGRPMEPGAEPRARPAAEDWMAYSDPVWVVMETARDWSMSLGDMQRAWQAFEAWQAEHERRKEQA